MARIQIILPPATAQDRLVISIRKQTINDVTLDDYAALNAFSNTHPCYLNSHRQNQLAKQDDHDLLAFFQAGKYVQF